MATYYYTTSAAWSDWNSASTTTYSSNSETWRDWNTSTSTYASTTGGYSESTWYYWTSETRSEPVYVQTGRVSYSPPKLSHAEKMQQKINLAWIEVEKEERRLAKEEAELTAQKLLMDLITEEQMEEYKKTGNLVVKGRKHDYVLRKNGVVYRVEKDKVESLCIHLKDRSIYPQTDNVIALKLALDESERRFNREANATAIYDKKRKDEVLELVKKAA
jgi:hypothetical protein